MPPYPDLTAEQCPLLAGDPAADGPALLDLANACGRLLNELAAGELAAVLATDDGRRLVGRYDKARGEITRRHYRVGFLGTSSAGKSTLFNHVLGETVAASGSGEATTSLPSRLRRSDGPKTCRLRYMTAAEYRDRLKKLCQAVGIGGSPEPNAELARLLADLVPRLPGGGDPTERPVRKEDIDYLRAFFDSYQAHHAGKLGKETEVPFDDRARYINHSYTGGGPAPDGLLLAEAHLSIPNPNLPDRLEMCDLPGLNANRSVDGVVTADFIADHLDGALVFVNAAENLANAVVKEILGRLAARYGELLTGRAWVVFNKCDSLSRHHYLPAAGQRSVFENILELLRAAHVPVSQVCFTSSRLIEAAHPPADAAGAAGGYTPATAAALLGLAGDPTPATCPPDLRPVWGELVRDGGLGRLRHLIRNEMARSVAAQIRRSAAAELARLREDIGYLVEAERRRRAGGPALRQKAVSCRNAVLGLRQGLAARPNELPVLADLRHHLGGRLDKLVCPDDRHAATLRTMSAAQLAGQFDVDARNLDETLSELLSGEVVDAVYRQVGEYLDPLPPVPVGKYAGLTDAWQDFRRADRDAAGWANGLLPRFGSDELRDALTDPDGYHHFDGQTYLDLMGEKVRVSVAQVVHALRTRLRTRLGELEAGLDQLLRPDPPAA